MRKLILIVISAVTLLASPAFAKEAASNAWIVSQLSGDARVVHPGLQPVTLTTAARLEPGDRVVTGLTGRATLTRGADYIILAPRSDLQLPATPQPAGFTRVIQNLGTLLFKVKHTGIPHFAVDTPMLAAVVKGTTFTVVVGPDRSAVQVIQGKVQVTAADGGMSRLVEGGKTVFIDRREPKRLIDADERSPAATTSSSVKVSGSQTPSVTAIAGLTGGLVHPGVTDTTASPAATVTSAPSDPGTTVVKVTQPVVTVVDATPPAVTDTVTDVVGGTTPVVTDTVTDAVGTVTDVVDTTVPGVTDTVTDVVGTVTDVVDTTVPGVTDTVTDVVGTVTDVVDTTVPAVTDTVTDVVGTVADVVDTTVPAVTDTVTDVVDTVTDVVEVTVPAVTDTVTDVVGGVTDPVTDVAGGVTDVVSDLLGGGNSGPGSDNSGPSGNSGSGSSGSSGSDSGLLGGLLPH
jgi:hypothetical protein